MTNTLLKIQDSDANTDGHNASLPGLSKDDIVKSRTGALTRWDVKRFQHMQPDELAEVQSVLHHGAVYGIWQTPANWLTKKERIPSYMNIDLRRRLKTLVLSRLQDSEQHYPDLDHWLDQAVLTMTRFLLLLRCAKSLGTFRNSYIGPSSIIKFANNASLLRCLPIAIVKGLKSQDESAITPRGERRIFGQITAQEALDGGDGSHWSTVIQALDNRLCRWAGIGYWSDVFATQGTSASEDLKAGKATNNRPQHDPDEFKPLPDDYTALLAKRSLWLMREISPNLVRLAPELALIYGKTATAVRSGSLSQKNLAKSRWKAAKRVIPSFIWLDSTDQPLTRIPFRLGLTNSSEKHGWLPQTLSDFFDLMAYVQTAHQVIVGLTMGLRLSELLDMTRGCVIERTKAGELCYYVNSRTFKTVAAHEGEIREWPVVVQVKQAVENQEALMARLDEINKARDPSYQPDTALWGRFYLQGNSEDPFLDMNLWLHYYAKALDMDGAPGGQNFTSHRLRKTLARIVALALVDSPMVLHEIFGHRDIEMTLHYILANKDLRLEIEAIAREINVMRATEVVEVMAQAELRRLTDQSLPGDLHGGCGGGAAELIDAHVQEEVQKAHERGEEWGAESAIELGRLLTNAGQQWMLVRKGVICTKSPGTAGPCSRKSRGRPEPSKCSSQCSHRLEREFLRHDVRGILDTAVKAYEQALTDDERGLAAYWGGQIRINIGRFPDIEQEYMRMPSIAAYMSEVTA